MCCTCNRPGLPAARELQTQTSVRGSSDPGTSMRDPAVWCAGGRWGRRSRFLLNYNLVLSSIRDKMEVEHLYPYLSLLSSGLVKLHCCFSLSWQGAAWPCLSQALLPLEGSSRLCGSYLNPRASRSPSNASLWVSVSVEAFSNITLVL